MNDRFMLIDSSNKMICEGLVKEFWRGDAVFKVENGLDALDKITSGQYVRFSFMAGRKGLFEGVVVKRVTNEIIIEEIRSIAGLVKEDVRIEADFQSRLFAKDSEGNIFAWDIVINDISAGGVRLSSDYSIPMNRVIEVAIPYYSWYIVTNAILIREIKDNDSEMKYSYGCRFYELTNVEENMIRSMVFKIAARKAGKIGGKKR